MDSQKQIVQLTSFNGTMVAPEPGLAQDNYWQLIGEKGKVIDAKRPLGMNSTRVLVLFDTSLDLKGLHNHNEVKNALWIDKNDLVRVDG
jgi:hypothetical protein